MFVIVVILATEISERKYTQNANIGGNYYPNPTLIGTNVLE